MQFIFCSDMFVKRCAWSRKCFRERMHQTFHVCHFLDLCADGTEEHLFKYFVSALISALKWYKNWCCVAFKC